MGRDRSLDEFVAAEDAPTDDGDADERSAAPASSADAGASDGSDDTDTVGSDDTDTVGSDDTDAAGSDDTDATGSDASADGGESATHDTSVDGDGVEPAVATYRWDPGGVECPACGRTVEQRWIHEGRHVCADCKEW